MFLRTTVPITNPGPVTWLAVLTCAASGLAKCPLFSPLLPFLPGPDGGGIAESVLAFVAAWGTFVIGPPVEARLGSRNQCAVFLAAVAISFAPLPAFGAPTFVIAWFSLLTGVQMAIMPWARIVTVAPFFRYFWPLVEAPGLIMPLVWFVLVGACEGAGAVGGATLLFLAGTVAGRMAEHSVQRRTVRGENSGATNEGCVVTGHIPGQTSRECDDSHPRDLRTASKTLRAGA